MSILVSIILGLYCRGRWLDGALVLEFGLPLGGLNLQRGVGDQIMPDEGLQGFGKRGKQGWIADRNNYSYVRLGGGEPACAAGNAEHLGSAIFGRTHGFHKIYGDSAMGASPSYGKHQKQVKGSETGALEIVGQ